MSICFCRAILAILVIVVAWWNPGFAKIALTVLGGLLFIFSLTRACCCQDKKVEQKEE